MGPSNLIKDRSTLINVNQNALLINIYLLVIIKSSATLFKVYHSINIKASSCPIRRCCLRTRLLAGSMVLSNVDERLSNVDEPKMFTVYIYTLPKKMCGKATLDCQGFW